MTPNSRPSSFRHPFFFYSLLAALLLSAVVGMTSATRRAAASLEHGFVRDQVAHASANSPVVASRGDTALIHDRLSESYGKLPLSFEANQGQADRSVKFISRGGGYTLFLTPTEAVLQLRMTRGGSLSKRKEGPAQTINSRYSKSAVLRMKFAGANPAPQVAGEDVLRGVSNYFIGQDPAKWRTNIRTFQSVRYREIYDGIDMVYYGNQRQLEYDFIVAPGGNPGAITMAFEGTRAVEIDVGGNLILRTKGGEVRQRKPVVYQETGGEVRHVGGRYVKKGKQQVGFEVGAYDPTRPLMIDPVLVYSTYLGGTGGDIGFGIAVDSAGSAYVTGSTASSNFPTSPGAFGPTHSGGGTDAFVAKLDPSGTSVIYSTHLGGGGDDLGRGIFVDALGQAYVTGSTTSSNFPTTLGAFDTSYNGGSEAFVTKLDVSGSTLVYSTYLGGNSNEDARGIKVDGGGNAYVSGDTSSTNFPTTAGAFDTSYNGGGTDAFVTKLSAGGAGLVYSTYLGGNGAGLGSDIGHGIALDGAGSAYVTGYTLSPDFPTTPGAFDTSYNGDRDGYVAKLNSNGSALAYSTYLGGSASDTGFGIAVDAAGYAYITGETFSANFPTTPGAFDNSISGSLDAFVSKLDFSGSALTYSTYLGGSIIDSTDTGYSIAIDATGNAYVTGFTDSPDFPTTGDAFDASFNGNLDGFVTRLNASGSALGYSTYLGGNSRDGGRGIAVDATANIYVAGETTSANFPTTAGATDVAYNGHFDVFIAKIGEDLPPDTDGDGVPDSTDNCPLNPNAGQADNDLDGIGDACDACPADPLNDTDGDGVCGNVDNCPTTANTNQQDSDQDGIGDACDACPADPLNDADGDGVCGNVDNCQTTANTDQADADHDGRGDVCDACPADPLNDADGDGVCGNVDNCPTTPNPNQADADHDGRGDVCDACPLDAANDADGDGVCGNVDNCPTTFNPDQRDTNGDGLGDACTPFQFPVGGQFVIGDLVNQAGGVTVNFWSSQWSKNNPMSGGAGPNAFKGFEDGTVAPSCGATWTSRPGNSSNPPATLPQYMAVIVSSSITKNGSVISGNIQRILVVKTNPGYGANPGHAGTGQVVAIVCGAPPQSTSLVQYSPLASLVGLQWLGDAATGTWDSGSSSAVSWRP